MCLSSVLQQSTVLGQSAAPKKVAISKDITLHYVERGAGEPIIFIHGLSGDYSIWMRQLDAFAERGYRAIAYSRRYNYPNQNTLQPDHSAVVEADDLAKFIRKLGLPKAHIVGHSYGAYTALLLSLEHPELVQNVILAEPPIVPWLADLPGDQAEAGKLQLNKLMDEGVHPAKQAFLAGNDQQGLQTIFDCIAGKPLFARLPEFVKMRSRRNIKEVKAIMLSDDRYPEVDRDRVRQLQVPTLILSGGDSLATAKLTDLELERLIPEQSRRRVVLQGATHIMWIEKPVECREAVLDFINE